MTDPTQIDGGPFSTWMGLTLTEASGSRVAGTCPVTPALHQPFGIVHGGVYCALVESLASYGGQFWLQEQGSTGHVVGVNNNTDFLRSVRDGTLVAVATPVHRGRSQQVWTVEIRDEQDRLVARGNVRLANLDTT